MLLQAFFLIYPNRFDMVIYGRYVEFLIIPVLLFGIDGLYKYMKYKSFFLLYVLTAICSQAVKYLFRKFDLKPGISYLAPGVFSLFSKNKDLCEATDIAVITVFVVSFLACAIHWICKHYFQKSGFFICLILCVLLWGYNISDTWKLILEDQRTLYEEYLPMAEILKESDKNIGFIVDEAESDEKRIRAIQFFIGSREIERLDPNKLDNYSDRYIILISKGTNTYSKIDKGKIIFQNYRYVLVEA